MNSDLLNVAIIGTADRGKELELHHWESMCAQTKETLEKIHKKLGTKFNLISGGAAWADHVAVHMFFTLELVDKITLHLPAPVENDYYVGTGFKTAGSISNYHHKRFSDILGYNTITDIQDIINMQPTDDVEITQEAPNSSSAVFFKRNSLVANADVMIALTTSKTLTPNSSGTLDTWNKFQGNSKIHLSI